MVAQDGASDMTFSSVSERDVAEVARRPDVARVAPFVVEVLRVGDNPYFIVFGARTKDMRVDELTLLDGRWPAGARTNEVVLGRDATKQTGSAVGDDLTLEHESFRVVGTYGARDKMREGGAFAPLGTVQRLANKRDAFTGAFVNVAPGQDPDAVGDAIERDMPQLASVRGAEDYKEIDQGMELMDAANLAISLLAVGIGAIGVMNTMIMSVFERTREIGIVRAIGWRGSRIFRMIGYESLVLCLVASVVGTGLGILASRAVLLVPAVSTLIEPAYETGVFVRALAVGVIVAIAGAAYPAFRAVRLSPMEALRHE
jgi:putative ABC transport system permease protein